MAKSKKSSGSNTDIGTARGRLAATLTPAHGAKLRPRPSAATEDRCKTHFNLVEPQINAEGVHIWPFDAACPGGRAVSDRGHDSHKVRMNRHGYFEILYLCSGYGRLSHSGPAPAVSTRATWPSSAAPSITASSANLRSPVTIAAMFFEPDLIRCDGGQRQRRVSDAFPAAGRRVSPHCAGQDRRSPPGAGPDAARSLGVAGCDCARARLAVKTYLKMVLMLLVNQYAPYAGTVETFLRQQRALERLRPLFRYLGDELWRTDSGSRGRAHLRNERIAFHELLQARDRIVVCDLLQSFQDRAGAGATGKDRRVNGRASASRLDSAIKATSAQFFAAS